MLKLHTVDPKYKDSERLMKYSNFIKIKHDKRNVKSCNMMNSLLCYRGFTYQTTSCWLAW